MNTSPNVAQTDPSIIIDKKSGKQFRIFRYFGHKVIQDIETGWINAGKFIKEIGKLNERDIKMKDFKTTKDYQLSIEYMKTLGLKEIHRTLKDEISYEFSSGYGNDVKGSYTPFPIFQIIALWADKRHKFAILESLSYINDIANAKDVSTYNELKQINEQLKNQLEILEKEKLELTTPINPLISPSCIYAIPINDEYFQLKYASTKVSPKVNVLRTMEIVNAKIVLDETKKYLNYQEMITIVDNKKGIEIKQIDDVFDIIDKIKHGSNLLQLSKTKFIEKELKRIDQFKPSPQVDGKRFELTLIQSNENWIPWDLVPLSIRGPINEMHRDNGIDAVVVNDNQITEIIQIKHHNDTYLKYAEIQTFIAKCTQARYANTRKSLSFMDVNSVRN